jgi:hypothetical protein
MADAIRDAFMIKVEYSKLKKRDFKFLAPYTVGEGFVEAEWSESKYFLYVI